MTTTPQNWTGWLIAAVIVLGTMFTLYGTNNRVSDLDDRTDRLFRKVQALEVIADRVREVKQDVREIRQIRREIIDAIEDALRGKPPHSRSG